VRLKSMPVTVLVLRRVSRPLQSRYTPSTVNHGGARVHSTASASKHSSEKRRTKVSGALDAGPSMWRRTFVGSVETAILQTYRWNCKHHLSWYVHHSLQAILIHSRTKIHYNRNSKQCMILPRYLHLYHVRFLWNNKQSVLSNLRCEDLRNILRRNTTGDECMSPLK